jgi:hypothetical protein
VSGTLLILVFFAFSKISILVGIADVKRQREWNRDAVQQPDTDSRDEGHD